MTTIELFRDWRDAAAMVKELEKAEAPLFTRTSKDDLREHLQKIRKRLAQARALAEEAKFALLGSLDADCTLGSRCCTSVWGIAKSEFPQVTDEAKAELDAMLKTWADKHIKVEFWIGVRSPELIEPE